MPAGLCRSGASDRFGVQSRLVSIETTGGVLDDFDLTSLEVRLSTLGADPGRDSVPMNVIPMPIERERNDASVHLSSAMKALHFQRLLRKSPVH